MIRSTCPIMISTWLVKRLWKIDRDSLGRVSGCFRRLVCQYQDVRAGIGGVEIRVRSEDGKGRAGR
jgi:hypothetical protein